MGFIKKTLRGLIKEGSIEEVRAIIDKNPKIADGDLICSAMDADQFEIFVLIAEARMNVHPETPGQLRLSESITLPQSAENGQINFVHYIVKQHAYFRGKKDHQHENAYQRAYVNAADSGHLNVMILLEKYHVFDVIAKMNAFHFAKSHDHTDVMEHLGVNLMEETINKYECEHAAR
jgi:hypothetical protein